jgi:hypothetical protein
LERRIEKPGEMFLALQGLGIQIEEEPFEWPQRRVGEAFPHAQRGLAPRDGRFVAKRRRGVALLLDGGGDRREQSVLRAEVVDQHVVRATTMCAIWYIG